MRPAELARDETPHLPVIQHAVAVDAAITPATSADAVIILQPTSPLRSAADIAAALRMLELSGADSVVSVTEVSGARAPDAHAARRRAAATPMLFVTGEPVRNRINRRQDLPRAWVMNGAIYACRTDVLFDAEPSLYGDRVVAYPMPAERSISIDDLEDWDAAERALANQPHDPSPSPRP